MSAETGPLQEAYKRLLALHHTVLLKHGGDVAQGVALAVKEVAQLIPEDERQAALIEWNESTPDDWVGVLSEQ